MFISPIPDVAFGVVFTFLAVSLAAGAAVESLASLLKLRSRTLLSGVKALVNDPKAQGLVLELYRHAAVNPRDSGTARSITEVKNKPAYIDPQQFAQALMDIVGLSSVPSGASSLPEMLARVNVRVPTCSAALARAAGADKPIAAAPSFPDDQLNQLLTGIVHRAQGDITRIRNDVAAWFDAAMDRVSGSYKRRAQLMSFLFALLFAGLFNFDCIHLALRLWQQPVLARSLVIGDGTTAESLIEQADRYLPVGWSAGQAIWPQASRGDPLTWLPVTSAQWLMLLGWLITGFAALFGAPFWFDTLQKIARLRGSGPSPVEKR